MSTLNLNAMTEKLKLGYRSTLLQISHKLKKFQTEELLFYYDEVIEKEDTEPLALFRSLEYAGKLSWKDVSFLKEGLLKVRRLDLVKDLTEFEVNRNFALLLDLYGKMKQSSQWSYSSFESMIKVANHLTFLMRAISEDEYDVSDTINKFMEAGKEFKSVLNDFEEETERELSEPWSKLTLLFLVSGELITANMLKEAEHGGKPNAPDLCFTAAKKLSSRMFNLGMNWVSIT